MSSKGQKAGFEKFSGLNFAINIKRYWDAQPCPFLSDVYHLREDRLLKTAWRGHSSQH